MAPILVQTVQGSGTASTLTLTLSATTAGNCLIVKTASGNATTNAAVSGITLGGSADNFAQSGTVGTGAGTCIASIWADPDCAGGQTSVVVTTTGGVGSAGVCCSVQEWSGLVASSVVDQTASQPDTASASWTSTATAATTLPSEVAVGAVAVSPGSTPTVTGPAPPWVNTALVSQVVGGVTLSMLTGSDILSSTGTPAYAGSFSGSTTYIALIVTFFAMQPQSLTPVYPRPSNRVVTVPFFAGVAGAQHSR